MSAGKCENKIGFIFNNALINLINDCCDSSSSSSCSYSSSSSTTSCSNYASSSNALCKKASKYDFFSTESRKSSSNLCKSSKHYKKGKKHHSSSSSSSCSINCKVNTIKTNDNCANNIPNCCEPKYSCCNKQACVQKFCSQLFGGQPKYCYITLCKTDLVSQTLSLATTFEECWAGFLANLYQLLKGSFLISFNKCGIIITIYAQLFRYQLCKETNSVKLYFKYNIAPSGQCNTDIKNIDIYYKLHNEVVSDVRFYYDVNDTFNPIRNIVYPQY